MKTNYSQAKLLFLTKVGNWLENSLVKQAKTISATNEMANKIHSQITSDGLEVTGVGYTNIAMEHGRKPGRVPPMSALKRWARLKLGDEKLAFAVAKSIAKKGTARYRGGERLVTKALNGFDHVLDRELDKLLNSII